MQYWIIKKKEDVKRILKDVYEKATHHDYVKPMTIHFEEYKNTRSHNQNSLSHVWYRAIAKYLEGKMTWDDGTPFTEDDVKQMLKWKYLPTKPTMLKGKEIHVPVDTSTLPSGEMYEFMERVNQWAIHKGLTLPVPEDSQFYKMRLQNDWTNI